MFPVTWPDCQNEIYSELLNLNAEREVSRSTFTGEERRRRRRVGYWLIDALLMLYNDYLDNQHRSDLIITSFTVSLIMITDCDIVHFILKIKKEKIWLTASYFSWLPCLIMHHTQSDLVLNKFKLFFAAKEYRNKLCPHRFTVLAAAEEVQMLVFSGERRLTHAGLLLAPWVSPHTPWKVSIPSTPPLHKYFNYSDDSS